MRLQCAREPLDFRVAESHAPCHPYSVEGSALNSSDFDEIHEMLFRLGLATVLGGVLGIDRDLHRKPAGVRVLAMVCLGSAAITMASIAAMAVPSEPPVDGVLRTVQGVLSGIGFLGAGVIMRAPGKEQVHGITTASSIWISAILGMVLGLGQWRLGLCSFGLAWVVLIGGRRIEALILKFAPLPEPTSSSPASPVD